MVSNLGHKFIFLLCCSFFNIALGDTGQHKLTLIYSANLNGELEPCGCAEESNLGGILRRYTMLKKMRSENPDALVISAGGLLSSESPRDKLKSEYILKGFAALNYDAIGVQWRDLAYGADFLQQNGVPFSAYNWLGEEYPKHIDLKRGNVNIVFFNWLDPNKSPFLQMAGNKKVVHDAMARLNSDIKTAKQRGAFTIVTSTYSTKQAIDELNLDSIDILIVRVKDEKYAQPERHGKTLVLQPGSRGMRLGRLDLTLDKNNSILHFNQEIFKLPETVADAPELSNWYQQYNDRVKQDYLKRVEIRKQLETGTSPYIGDEACQSCHENQYVVWKKSKHAHAFEKLEEVNKAFDPDCIGCHTVGFEKDGGYIDASITAHLLHVQCESCHGAARDHVVSGGKMPTQNVGWDKEQRCRQCHIGSHSPVFNLDTYWPQIAH